MTVTRNYVKGCCGGSGTIVFYTDRPIVKHQVQVFKDAGYTVPEHYLNNGIFYVRKESLFGTASFGMTKVNVRCGLHRRDELLNEFEQVLEKAINS